MINKETVDSVELGLARAAMPPEEIQDGVVSLRLRFNPEPVPHVLQYDQFGLGNP
jgi:hypothetical protein